VHAPSIFTCPAVATGNRPPMAASWVGSELCDSRPTERPIHSQELLVCVSPLVVYRPPHVKRALSPPCPIEAALLSQETSNLRVAPC
jgi:hypothetical protein